MSLAIVDASVLVAFYTTDDRRRPRVVERLGRGDALFAPAHLDVEVVSALRNLVRRHPDLRQHIPESLAHLAGFPIRRLPAASLLTRIWALRDNVTPFDAAYVALAEQLGGPLITCDVKLAAATGPDCSFDLIA